MAFAGPTLFPTACLALSLPHHPSRCSSPAAWAGPLHSPPGGYGRPRSVQGVTYVAGAAHARQGGRYSGNHAAGTSDVLGNAQGGGIGGAGPRRARVPRNQSLPTSLADTAQVLQERGRLQAGAPGLGGQQQFAPVGQLQEGEGEEAIPEHMGRQGQEGLQQQGQQGQQQQSQGQQGLQQQGQEGTQLLLCTGLGAAAQGQMGESCAPPAAVPQALPCYAAPHTPALACHSSGAVLLHDSSGAELVRGVAEEGMDGPQAGGHAVPWCMSRSNGWAGMQIPGAHVDQIASRSSPWCTSASGRAAAGVGGDSEGADASRVSGGGVQEEGLAGAEPQSTSRGACHITLPQYSAEGGTGIPAAAPAEGAGGGVHMEALLQRQQQQQQQALELEARPSEKQQQQQQQQDGLEAEGMTRVLRSPELHTRSSTPTRAIQPLFVPIILQVGGRAVGGCMVLHAGRKP